MASKSLRTPSGNPTAYARDKYGFSDGSFPIFDKKSADAALHLIGHASPGQKSTILRKAARYDPKAVAEYRKNH